MTLAECAEMDEDAPGELVNEQLVEDEDVGYLYEDIVAWLGWALRSWLASRGGFVGGSDARFGLSRSRGRKPDLSVVPTSGARVRTFGRCAASRGSSASAGQRVPDGTHAEQATEPRLHFRIFGNGLYPGRRLMAMRRLASAKPKSSESDVLTWSKNGLGVKSEATESQLKRSQMERTSSRYSAADPPAIGG